MQNPTGKLSCSVLDQPAGNLRSEALREVHLLNYDFTYDAPGKTLADDDGSAEARSYLSDTSWRMKKILNIPDPAEFEKPALNIMGSPNSANQLIQLVVSLNGTDIATIAAEDITGSLFIPVTADQLRAGDNEIILRLEGQPNSQNEWYQVSIDTDATTKRSFFSEDGGATWQQDDLSGTTAPRPASSSSAWWRSSTLRPWRSGSRCATCTRPRARGSSWRAIGPRRRWPWRRPRPRSR